MDTLMIGKICIMSDMRVKDQVDYKRERDLFGHFILQRNI